MPELPEVHTTATMLNKLIKDKIIIDIWSEYNSDYYLGKENIKDISYFKKLKKEILGKKIVNVTRRAKHVLIKIDSEKILVIHLKMTGHLLFGKYQFIKKEKKWLAVEDGPLKEPKNQFIRFVISFSDGTHLSLSDMRKFATISLIKDKNNFNEKFDSFGPEPLEEKFDWKSLKKCLLKKKSQKIKTALMDQTLISGIGNIYSDEILWTCKINPEKIVSEITDDEYKNITKNTKFILKKGISLEGDSMSDYRKPDGLPGKFQLHHNAYRRTGLQCKHKNCKGQITRKVVNGRSAHFCKICQE